jgi:outer membrane protein assembly factor BamD (BamD/ComL family)
MGKKQGWRGKHFYLFSACIIIASILLSGCAHFYEELMARPDFDQAEDLTRQGNYNAAQVKYEQLIDHYPLAGDQALFQTGIIYAMSQNKHKDYHKALEYFQRLVNKYPKSKYRRNSEVLISLISEIVSKDKRAITQHKQIDKLEQQVDKLKQQADEVEKKLEQMKEVDMNLKQKKKKFP